MHTHEYTKNSDPNYFFEHVRKGNCGSFALNVKEWYVSDRDFDNTNEARYMLEEGRSLDEIFDYLTTINIEQILEDFKEEIRVLIDKDDVQDNEELIAFRLGIFEDEDFEGIDTDFHFKVRRDGSWMEKCGSTEVRFCELNEDEEWSNSSGDRYNGPIVFLAKKI